MTTSPSTAPEAITHELTFSGGLLKRGFWLYIWEITTPDESHLYYVGRTGDSSSSNAQSPFNRMGQHLGFRKESNSLRRRLEERGIDPETCSFRLVAFGPILKEEASRDTHRECRDRIAPMEKALADAMTAAGYHLLNTVNCRVKLDTQMFVPILSAFAREFPKLSNRMESHESR